MTDGFCARRASAVRRCTGDGLGGSAMGIPSIEWRHRGSKRLAAQERSDLRVKDWVMRGLIPLESRERRGKRVSLPEATANGDSRADASAGCWHAVL